MTTVASPPPRLGTTARRDRWWVQPVAIVIALTLFGIYSIFRVILSKHYAITADGARLQSPFFSPDLPGILSFNTNLPWAFLVLWSPLGLRTTCYYYRKSYYRSFFLAPPSCAVAGVARRKYTGETKFPLVLNNLHRIFFYLAAIVVGFLWYDAIRGSLLQRDLRDRRRQRDHARQRDLPVGLHVRLQLLAPHHRRQAELLLLFGDGADASHGSGRRSRSSTAATWNGPGSACSRSA